jgi:hypothetical protein
MLDEHFFESQRTIKDTGHDPPWSQMASRIPRADETAPPVQALTQGPDLQRIAPLWKGAGLAMRPPKSPQNIALDELGMTQGDIMGSSGSREFDTLAKKYAGDLFDQIVGKMVQTPNYLEADEGMRGVMMKTALKQVRLGATRSAARERGDLYEKTREAKLQKYERRARHEAAPAVEARSRRMERRRVGQQ